MAFCQNCGSFVTGSVCPNCGQQVLQTQAQAQQQPQPMPGQPPKSNTGKLIAIITAVVVVVVILAALLLFLQGSKDSKDSDGEPKGYVFEMTDTDTMEVDAKAEVKGNKAKQLREHIDEIYGDDDGEVSSSEVNDYEEGIEDLLIGRHSEHEIDDETGKYTHYSEKITNAEGDIDSDEPILGEFSATIFWPYIDTDQYSYDIELSVSPDIIEDFKFISPPGYEIDYIDGLDDEEYSDGSTIVEGKLGEDEVIQITIVEIGGTETTPRGSLWAIEDSNVAGKYWVSFEGSVKNEKISIVLFDESKEYTVVLDQPKSGNMAQVPGGANLTYWDNNDDDKLDASDSMIIYGGEVGDQVFVRYIPTGETVALTTLD